MQLKIEILTGLKIDCFMIISRIVFRNYCSFYVKFIKSVKQTKKCPRIVTFWSKTRSNVEQGSYDNVYKRQQCILLTINLQ